MSKRMIDARASDFAQMDGAGLAKSIRTAEGRTVAAEVIATYESPVEGVSHGEICGAFGADILCLDRYDCKAPSIPGAPHEIVSGPTPLADYAKLTGRPVGINMICADPTVAEQNTGQYYTEENFETVVQQGVDLVFFYAIASDGGTIERQAEVVRNVRATYGDRVLIAGVPFYTQLEPPTSEALLKEHETAVRTLIEGGCHMIGFPMPGTSQGWRIAETARLVDVTHEAGALAWLFITGSVEGAQESILQRLAMEAKMIGADAVRVDEAGLSGMPLAESVYAFSRALRGVRHTYRRMAMSPLR